MKKFLIFALLLAASTACGTAAEQPATLVKKARRAAYDWVRQYSVAVRLDSRQAGELFSTLFVPNARLFPDYDPALTRPVTPQTYMKGRQSSSLSPLFYQISNNSIVSERAVDGTIESVLHLSLDIIQPSGDSLFPILSAQLAVRLVYDTLADASKAQSVIPLSTPEFHTPPSDRPGQAARKSQNDKAEQNAPPEQAGQAGQNEQAGQAGSHVAGQSGNSATLKVIVVSQEAVYVRISNPEKLKVILVVLDDSYQKSVETQTFENRSFIQKKLSLPKAGTYHISAKVGDEMLRQKIVIQ